MGSTCRTYLLAGVLEHDVFAACVALGDGDGSLGGALVSGLCGHLSFDHLANFEGGICGGMDPFYWYFAR